MSEYNPHQYVPDEIDTITADGLAELHEELNEKNAARLRHADPHRQASVLWALVDEGQIDLTVGAQR